jgi:LPXTG-site transpeptidase (sortase) family protein
MASKVIKKNSKSKNLRFIPLIIGILLMVLGSGYIYYQKTILSFDTNYSGQLSNQIIQNRIKTISIPDIGINLPVTETTIHDGIWQIPDRTAAHLALSANPKNSGNIIIYGHNTWDIFGKIVNIKMNDRIKLITANDNTYFYTVTAKKIVSPSDISLVLPTKTETLTIYTCTGFLDSQRLVIQAKPIIPTSTLIH